MKIATINLPEKYLDAIQVLIKFERYPSRSEALRTAIREFLEKETDFKDDLDNLEELIQ